MVYPLPPFPGADPLVYKAFLMSKPYIEDEFRKALWCPNVLKLDKVTSIFWIGNMLVRMLIEQVK